MLILLPTKIRPRLETQVVTAAAFGLPGSKCLVLEEVGGITISIRKLQTIKL